MNKSETQHAKEVKQLQANLEKYPDMYFHHSREKILRLEKQIRKEKALASGRKGLSPERIALARDYPITDLIEHKRYFAKCPFHPDKTASMYLKNNFYHCFGCQEHGDVIDFIMKTENLTFKQAVEQLT